MTTEEHHRVLVKARGVVRAWGRRVGIRRLDAGSARSPARVGGRTVL